jgi:hypothetical protein
MNEIVLILGAVFGGISLLIVVVEKLWGGGNALAGKFHKLDKETTAATTASDIKHTAAINALRIELMNRVDLYEDNYKVGMDAITSNIHALREGLLEFRAKMAEQYVAKGGLDDLRADMRRGFEAVERRTGELQDMIMWAQPPQASAGGQGGQHKQAR